MINRKKKICLGCGLDKYIFSRGLCNICASKKSKPISKRKKVTGEKKLFLELWTESPHVCTNCCIGLGDEPVANFFSHKLSKGAHPDLRLDPSNIEILCKDCHHAWEFQSKEKFNERKNLYCDEVINAD